MSLGIYYIGVEGDCCKCNRKASVPHCMMCGSFKIRAVKDYRSMPAGCLNGETGWKCEKCGFGFPDHERENCAAPVYLTKTMRAAADIVRTMTSLQQQHPLTEREKKIAKTVVASEEEQIRKVQQSFAEDKIQIGKQSMFRKDAVSIINALFDDEERRTGAKRLATLWNTMGKSRALELAGQSGLRYSDDIKKVLLVFSLEEGANATDISSQTESSEDYISGHSDDTKAGA